MLNPVAVEQVSIAVGPFTRINLTEFRASKEDDFMGKSAIDVDGYCLPGWEADIQNTCIFIHLASSIPNEFIDLLLTHQGG